VAIPFAEPSAGSEASRLVQRFAGAAIFAASFALAAYVVANKSSIDHLLTVVGPFRIPLAITIFAIVASAPFSVTDALAVSNGVLFGPWLGAAVNAGGLVLASIIGYAVALRTSKLLEIEGQVTRLPRWVKRFQVGSPLFLIAVRLIPGMGGTIATQTAAALHVPLWRQIYTMCAVTVPLCALLAFGGNAVSTYIEIHVVQPVHGYADRHHMHFPRHHETQ
jgi:uncharacterized membrane protein YdjX (TVP38/TMEM64 family)